MGWVELFQRATAKQLRPLPGCPERDFRLAQPIKIKRVDTLMWRQRMHALQMFIQQRMHSGMGKVVYCYFHVRRRWIVSGNQLSTNLVRHCP